jgi:hypothetical protein
MAEVLTRRFNEYEKAKHENPSEGFGRKPDLILLDGGIGQVNAVKPVLESFGLTDIPLFGILADSTAVIKSGRVVISSENPTLFDFICTDTHSRELSRAVYEVMGRKMKIAVSNPEKNKSAAQSPLENLKNKINNFNNNN